MRRLCYIAGAREPRDCSPQRRRDGAEARGEKLCASLRVLRVSAVKYPSSSTLLKNKSPCSLSILLLLIGLIAPLSPAASAHKFYASLAQADLNPETNSVEISLRLFSDDLELVLTRRAGRTIYLDRAEEAAPLVLAYLRERFELRTADGQVREIAWVGMESRVDATWVYFEIRGVTDLAGATLRNRIFFEQYDEQINTVNLRHGERHATLVFRSGDDFKSVFGA